MVFLAVVIFLKGFGGIPVFRDSPQGVVGQMAERFETQEDFLLAIVPEGTRKNVKNIKTGFWHIAKQANVSILCWYLDNDKKTTRWLGEIIPGHDKLEDILKIRQIYADAGYKFPLDVSLLKEQIKVRRVKTPGP